MIRVLVALFDGGFLAALAWWLWTLPERLAFR